jgi:hypothetical protein
MRTLKNKRSTTLSIIATFLLFFSSEKYASSTFSFFSGSIPLQETTITLIDSIKQYHIADIFALCIDLNSITSDNGHDSADIYFHGRPLYQIHHDVIARLVLKYRSVLFHNSFAQFRLDIKKRNLPEFTA